MSNFQTDTYFPIGGLPAIEVQFIEEEIRRLRRRMTPPNPLRSVNAQGDCLPVQLCFPGTPGKKEREANLVDITVGGFGVATTRKMEVDEEIELVAQDSQTGQLIFSEPLRVRNVRSKTALSKNGCPIYTYGMQSLAEEHSALYKCILDSIFLQHASGTDSEMTQIPWTDKTTAN